MISSTREMLAGLHAPTKMAVIQVQGLRNYLEEFSRLESQGCRLMMSRSAPQPQMTGDWIQVSRTLLQVQSETAE